MAPYLPPQKRDAVDSLAKDAPSVGGGCQDVRYSGDVRELERRGERIPREGWWGRREGRRLDHFEVLTELEVFGERKDRTSGIGFDQINRIPVEVTGDGGKKFKPINNFNEADLCEALAWNLSRCGYEYPTLIQRHAIPIVIGGRDVMACAQTGSGKTCAFMIPCLESLLRTEPPSQTPRRRHKPQPCALVLAPTRELIAQIHEESLKFAYNTGILSRVIYGGADMRDQLRELGKGTDVLAATPGRLSDLIGRECVDLGMTQFLILDEADRMLDMGFEPQVRDIVEFSGMGRRCERARQSMMFSATFQAGVQKLAGDFLKDYLFITVGRVGSCSQSITQKLLYAEDGKGKTRALDKIYREHAPPTGQLTVIFVETKRKADEIEAELWQTGLRVCAIHGDRDQREREQALEAFKSGENPVLIATDVAARGLDIANVGLVINYDMPKQMDDYVHRIGRTGRAGKSGVAIGFINEKCRYCNELTELLRETDQEVPTWLSTLATENSANYSSYRAKGKGNSSYGGVDMRELNKAPAKKVEAPPRPKTPPRPKSPPRVIPEAWDDSD